MSDIASKTVAVVGLGYVGLPLALAFGSKLNTIGFDISEPKLNAYRAGNDPTGEMEPERFQRASRIRFTSNAADLAVADFIVVAVPTPIDEAKIPDLSPVEGATKAIAPYLKPGAIIVYESTVYPGVTDDVCAPLLEKLSGKKRGVDFKLGYSPERINPGDKEHRLENITKIVAGEDAETLDQVAALYSLVVEVGVYRASSIKVAEAAKVIENTQRDVNIALINELALIFHRMGIDTREVLEAAGTKWNFLKFSPGLVGGHCIGVDPYYLTHKAVELGYHPEVILAGRRINDGMGAYIAQQTIKLMIRNGALVKGANVLVMGLTFKENCADVRNSKVIDIIHELRSYDINVLVWDPVVDAEEALHEYGVALADWREHKNIAGVVAAVSHRQIVDVDLAALASHCVPGAPFMDVKSAFKREAIAQSGFDLWRL